MIKKYIRIGIVILVSLLSISVYTLYTYNQKLKEETATLISNQKAFIAENSSLKNENRVFKFTIEQLNYYNDSILQKMNEVRKELKIKDGIIKMGYDNQLGQKDIINQMQQGFSYTNAGLERGFSNMGNLIQSVACDLKTNANCNTQRIIDTITANRYADLQERLEDAKRREQTTSIVAQLKTTTPTT